MTSSYFHTTFTTKGYRILAIVDRNLPDFMSVTNNIENIIQELNFKPSDGLIIYRDSEWNWDGWDGKNFIFLNSQDINTAVENYIKLKQNEHRSNEKLS